MKKSERLRRRQHDVEAFAAALRRLLDVCTAEQSLAGYPSWRAKPGYEAEAAERAAEVDRLSGKAALGLGHDFYIEWKPRGTWQTQPVNPASAWRTILDWDPHFDVDTIFAVSSQAAGVLEVWAAEAEEAEAEEAARREPRQATLRKRRSGAERDRRLSHVTATLVAFASTVIGGLIVAYVANRFGWV